MKTSSSDSFFSFSAHKKSELKLKKVLIIKIVLYVFEYFSVTNVTASSPLHSPTDLLTDIKLFQSVY